MLNTAVMKTPEFLGPYRIGEPLGRGGMGTVYGAVHEKTKERVAVKLIAEHVADEMRFRRRFKSEIDSLIRLRHDNIVRLIGYGEEQGQLFYSMELVQGESLQDRIRREKKLSWTTVLDIAIQVCGALKHAHDIGVIHRDLKPANLVLTSGDQVKVVDFGIAKIFGREHTAVGSVMGTADYMAPEQAIGSGITARTDLYSLGCVMYAMICGKPPFRGKNITEVIEKLRTKDPVPLDLVDPELPDDVVQIVHELLSKLPTDRPPTALAVMNRLKAMRAGLHKMGTVTRENNDTGVEDSPAELGTDAANPNDTNNQSRATSVRRGTAAGPKTHVENLGTGVEPPEHTIAANVDPKAGTIHAVGISPSDKTYSTKHSQTDLPSGSVGDDSGDGDTATSDSGATHFQTVSEIDELSGFLDDEKTVEEKNHSGVFSIIGIVLGLLVAAGAVVYAFQKPSADQLLAQVDEEIAGERMDEAQDTITRILKLYPDHPRAKEMRAIQSAFELDRIERQIRRRVQKPETPEYETQLLEALELRENFPISARDELIDWLAIFIDQDLSPESRRYELGELVKFEIERLEKENPKPKNQAQLDEILERVASSAELSKSDAIARLDAIISKYSDKTWAQPAIVAARERRDELDLPAQP